MTALRKYQIQKIRAKQRNIPFNLTFDEWMDIWTSSGKWEMRGLGKGKYCMSRIKDQGAYEIGNVYINLNENNAHDGTIGRVSPTKGKPHSEQGKENISKSILALPKVECPHCGKVGQSSVMKRWHFDNCKGEA